AKAWVNDSLVSAVAFNTTISTDNLDLTIGIDLPGIVEHFNGIIDDVRIYSRALNRKEIDSLANPIPTASLPDKSIQEGNSGITIMNFKLTLDQPYNKIVSVKWKTADSTAKAGSDYIAANGTLKFHPGQTSKTIMVQVYGDAIAEKDEVFKIVLRNPKNVFLGNTVAIGKIVNDDGALAGTISDIVSDEKSNGLSISAYPVPSKNFTILNIQNKSGNVNIIVTNTDGKIVWQQQNITVNKINIPLQNIPAGMYTITAIDANNNKSSIQIVRSE
ncbi:MAG: Calx-beta domain-containing protein, partial [Parafilimonas sp.]